MSNFEASKRINLRAARVNMNLTQVEAAEAINELCNSVVVTKDTISRWETGESFPDVRHIPAIERVYRRPYDTISFLPTNND